MSIPPGRTALLFALVNVPVLLLFLGLGACAARAWSTGHPIVELSWPATAWILAGLGLTTAGNLVLLRRVIAANLLLRDSLQKEADQQELLRALFDNAADGIVTCDEWGRIRALNKAAIRMFGFPLEEIVGQPLTRLFATEGQLTGMEEVKTNERRILGQMTELEALRKDGSRFPATVGVSKIRRAGQAFFTAILRDQTVVREGRRLAEAASQAKSSFLVNMSHEFRTPLHGILGLADLLRGTMPSDEQSSYLDHLTRASESLLAMVDQMLDFAQLEAGQVTLSCALFSLREVVQEAIAPLTAQAQGRGLGLAVQIDPRIPDAFLGDAARLRQMVSLVVGNAVKFTAQGEVVVRITEEPSLSPIVLEVRDTGVGIPPEKLESIFSAFEQVDSSSTRRHGGVGLGLGIVARIARLMGAQIDVESIPSRGTTFRVRIPLISAEDSFTPAREKRPPALLVLADGQRGSVIEEWLRGWGWHARHVQTEREAMVELLRGVIQGKPYGLLLVEQALPDLAFEKIVAQQLSITPDGFRVMLAGNPLPHADWPAGVHAVVPAGCDADQLRHVLQRLDPTSVVELAS